MKGYKKSTSTKKKDHKEPDRTQIESEGPNNNSNGPHSSFTALRLGKILPTDEHAASARLKSSNSSITTVRTEKILPVAGKLSKHTSMVKVYYNEPQSQARAVSPDSKYHLQAMSHERLYLRDNRTQKESLVAERIKQTFVKTDKDG